MLKIACYGYVEKNVGSVVGANFLILEELLKRGFQIDFYGWKGFTEPKELFKYKNFYYIAIPDRSLLRAFLKILPSALSNTIYSVAYLLFIYHSDNQVTRKEIIVNHQIKKYDLLIFLGLYSPFKIEDIPVISWAQGPPQTEWLFIQKLKKNIISLCGIVLYLKLLVFYAFKLRRVKAEVRNSDILICGSQWSKDQIISYRVKSEAVRVLPYPIDTELFNFDSSFQRKRDYKVFLWLGRCDPRKRLDLLLEAYALIMKKRSDVRLKIIGDLRYAKGYKKLIDNFEFSNYLEYQPSIERSQVPKLMAQCDILIQPSEGENFGSSVAEALCCGLPVIVGSTNGTKDYISSSSFIFEDYNSESLKKTMLQAIQAIEQDRGKLALEARQTAEKNFSVSRVVDCLEDIFQETLTRV
jgi:glycosyltransferase involved in cell wall biosynthesis